MSAPAPLGNSAARSTAFFSRGTLKVESASPMLRDLFNDEGRKGQVIDARVATPLLRLLVSIVDQPVSSLQPSLLTGLQYSVMLISD